MRRREMWLPSKAMQRFICTMKLRKSVPTDLTPIHDLFTVTYVPFSPAVLGCSMGRYIAINDSLHPYERRMVLAHEVAHQVLRHPNSLFLCRVGDWWYSRYEREAQQGAAWMLVSLNTLIEVAGSNATLREMQEFFEVPEELVALRLKMARLIL